MKSAWCSETNRVRYFDDQGVAEGDGYKRVYRPDLVRGSYPSYGTEPEWMVLQRQLDERRRREEEESERRRQNQYRPRYGSSRNTKHNSDDGAMLVLALMFLGFGWIVYQVVMFVWRTVLLTANTLPWTWAGLGALALVLCIAAYYREKLFPFSEKKQRIIFVSQFVALASAVLVPPTLALLQ